MQKRPIILFLLAILIVCFCFTSNEKPPILEGVFEDEVDCQISGIAYQMVKKEKSAAIYVKEVKILTLEGKSVQEKNYFCNKIIIYCIDTNFIEIGSKVLVKGTLQKFQNGSNSGQFDEKSYYKNKGISYKMLGEKAEVIKNTCMPLENLLFQYKNHIKQVYTSIFNEKDLGVIKAMILGDKSSLDLNIKELYQNNGISHILAISGVKTLCLVSPYPLKVAQNWAFFDYIMLKSIFKICVLKGSILPVVFHGSVGVKIHYYNLAKGYTFLRKYKQLSDSK